jgi:hypothetical protein
MAIVIGICGKKFHGKDTIADHYVKKYGFTKISLGDSLKHAMKNIFGFTDEQLWGNQKETKDTYWNATPRDVMQYIGTDLMREQFSKKYPHIGNNIWVMSIQRQIENLIAHGISKIIVPDLRFPNEEQMIRSFNGKIIRVIRDSLASTDKHISENSSEQIQVDYTIYNYDIDKLYVACDVIYDKIMSH